MARNKPQRQKSNPHVKTKPPPKTYGEKSVSAHLKQISRPPSPPARPRQRRKSNRG